MAHINYKQIDPALASSSTIHVGFRPGITESPETNKQAMMLAPVGGVIATHRVVDMVTKVIMKEFSNIRRARRYADKLDLEYGAIRYIVESITKK